MAAQAHDAGYASNEPVSTAPHARHDDRQTCQRSKSHRLLSVPFIMKRGFVDEYRQSKRGSIYCNPPAIAWNTPFRHVAIASGLASTVPFVGGNLRFSSEPKGLSAQIVHPAQSRPCPDCVHSLSTRGGSATCAASSRQGRMSCSPINRGRHTNERDATRTRSRIYLPQHAQRARG